jgi:hypothetical protein
MSNEVRSPAVKPKLRIGIMIDSLQVPAYFACAVRNILASGCATFELIVVNEIAPAPRSLVSKLSHLWRGLIFGLYFRADKAIFSPQPNALEPVDVRSILPSVPVLGVVPIRRKWRDSFQAESIDKIRSCRLDVMIREGFGILQGEILKVAKFGVWSQHHGDNRCLRGGPPGFHEVMEGWPVSGYTLQVLTEELDGGQVIYRSFTATDPLSVIRQYHRHHWKTSTFMARKLSELYRLGAEEFFNRASTLYQRPFTLYDRPNYRTPTNWKCARLVLRKLFRYLCKKVVDCFIFDQWILMFARVEVDRFSLHRFSKLMPPKDRCWADPHIIKQDGRLYVFLEEYPYTTRKGHISVMELDAAGRHGMPVPIIERPYHMSYPFLFEWEGNHFMIPETSANGTIDLYRCTEFPFKWEFVKSIMRDVVAVDATLILHEGRWWMFVNLRETPGAPSSDELFLFHAQDLFTDRWEPHPMNPIVSDVRRARCAGKPFQRDGKWFRPSQDCSVRYGYGLRLQEIVVLNEREYLEKDVAFVEPKWNSMITCIHTLAKEENFVMVDAIFRRRRLL